MMNKQQTQEAIEEVKNLIAKFERNASVADLADAAFNTYGMGIEFTTTLTELTNSITALEARIESPEYNAPVVVPTELNWFTEGELVIAEIIVDSAFVGGKWSVIVTEVPNYGYEVTLEVDRGWATSYMGLTSEANAQSAAQSVIEALAQVLTAYDGVEFVCDTFRQALANAESAQKAVA